MDGMMLAEVSWTAGIVLLVVIGGAVLLANHRKKTRERGKLIGGDRDDVRSNRK